MKNFIKPFSLFESKTNVEGLGQFIKTLKDTFKDHHNVIDDLKDYIVKSGCEAIGFDTLYGASGISKTDKCVIADKILSRPIENALYVILHEVSHQYQYSKYGKDENSIQLPNNDYGKSKLEAENLIKLWHKKITLRSKTLNIIK